MTGSAIISSCGKVESRRVYVREVEAERDLALGRNGILQSQLAEAERKLALAREALAGVLPYVEAERLAEEAAIRLGANRAPIRLAVKRARTALAALGEPKP